MFSVLRNRNFALLWIGQLVSLMGDFTLGVALPFYVLQLTGSVLQTGLMFIIETIPAILLGPLAGVFVDRWDRRKTMIVCNLLQACTLSFLLLVHSPHFALLVSFQHSFAISQSSSVWTIMTRTFESGVEMVVSAGD